MRKQKIALVTGENSGIGLATAKKIALQNLRFLTREPKLWEPKKDDVKAEVGICASNISAWKGRDNFQAQKYINT